jgi:para-aminobenzoate synthetase component 1
MRGRPARAPAAERGRREASPFVRGSIVLRPRGRANGPPAHEPTKHLHRRICGRDPRFSPGSQAIFAQRIDANGDTVWKAVGVQAFAQATIIGGRSTRPDGAGGAFLAWSGVGMAQRVMAQRVIDRPRAGTYAFRMPPPLFPLIREIDCFDPLELMPALSALRHPFLLHSTLLDHRGRWSFFGAEPFELFRGRNYEIATARWRALSLRTRPDSEMSTIVPFTGGVVGYWTYDFGRRYERLPEIAADDLRLPDFILGFYDVVGVFDHGSRKCWLFSSGLPYEGEKRAAHAVARLDEFTRWLEARAPIPRVITPPERRLVTRSSLDRDAYRRHVEAAQDRIRRGELQQVVLSQRWTLPVAGAEGALGRAPLSAERIAGLSIALHSALVDRSPAPFSSFFGAGDHAIVSASPERLIELRGRRVGARPMNGTRPRGDEPASDRALRAELEASVRDQIANAMIAEVVRRDLSQVCEPESLRTVQQGEVEALPQVYHLTSIIEGRLAEGVDSLDLLHACHPGGSVTGAPKLQARETIEALEPVRRHIYGGSIGYLDWRGDADWSVAIRTALVTAHAIHFAAGSGVTVDTDPDAAFRESLVKTEGLRGALEHMLGVERGAMRVPA